MAVSTGTITSVESLKANDLNPLQFAVVYFRIPATETYAQANDGIINAVPTAIQNSRRNGKTVTMKTVGLWQPARKESDPSVILALKTVAISSANVTFEVTLSATANTLDISSEYTNATAMVAQSDPFGILVGFTEA